MGQLRANVGGTWVDVLAGPPGPPGALESTATVDTGEAYRVIVFSDGTTRAIPVDAVAPATPTGLATLARINSVRLTWSAVSGATQYVVYRNAAQVAVVSGPLYRDSAVVVGSTYTYNVAAVSVYGLRSGYSSNVSAFIDPALNVAPTVEVTTWPAGAIALGNKVIVRVNAADVDAQLLALTLGTSVGSLVATADPTVWILEPV